MVPEKQKKIILIETNLFFSAKIVGQLKQLGYSVEVEKSYEGAKSKAGPELSAVIVDLTAKGIQALEIIKKLKNDPETASVPVIGFCGHKEEGLMRSAKDSGCDLVVTNAVMTSDLPALLEK